MADYNSFNEAIIAEFRANGGKVGGNFKNATMALLTTKGARTGQLRTTPLVYLPAGNRVIVFASKGGAPKHPSWYHNLVANPEVTVEVGTDRYRAKAIVLEGEERDRAYAEQSKRFPAFAEYQTKTERRIPVIALDRLD
jgi:deazaflavin-dependent oxidoreductase (nitroreductase family)